MYHAFSKNTDAGADVLKFVIDTAVNPPMELAKKRSRLLPQSSRLSINASSSNISIAPSEDAAIVASISYLTALHGIVWTFPQNMADVFSDPETGILLLGFISSTTIPLLVRQTLLCMVSNWCVLYRESIDARLNLESIVDTAKMKFGLRPQGHLLPDPPFTRGQEGWPYPTTRQESPRQQAFQQEQFSSSQIFSNIPSISARQTQQQQHYQQQPQYQYQQQQNQQPQPQPQPQHQQQHQQQQQQPLKKWDIRSFGRPASHEPAANADPANGPVSSTAISQKRSFLSSLRS
ncbi:hypothetical protein LPJ75_006883, partial [Coemansia sp. RSA 2598]